MPVVHQEHIAALEARRRFADPCPRGEIYLGGEAIRQIARKLRARCGERALDGRPVCELETPVVFHHDLLDPAVRSPPHAMHGKRIDELVGEMHRRLCANLGEFPGPLHFAAEFFQPRTLTACDTFKRLDDPVAHRAEAFGRHLTQSAKRVRRKIPAVHALFNDREFVRRTEPAPHFCKLPREQSTEQRTHAHIRKKIAATPDALAARGVVAVLRVIERQLHETPERHRPPRRNLRPDHALRRPIRPRRFAAQGFSFFSRFGTSRNGFFDLKSSSRSFIPSTSSGCVLPASSTASDCHFSAWSHSPASA